MDKEKIKQFITSQREAGIPDEQIHAFLMEKGAIQPEKPAKEPEKTFGQKVAGVAEKVADFTGGKEIAQGIGQALVMGDTEKRIQETQKQQFDLQGQLLAKIKENKQLGKDTSRLETALADLTEDIQATGEGAEAQLNPEQLTGKQIAGDVLQLATTAGAGKVAGGIVKGLGGAGATGIGAGALQGLKTGATTGAVLGTSTGVSQGLQDDLSAKEIASEGVRGATYGAIGGGILGAATGAISGGLRGRALRKELLNQRLASENVVKPTLTPKQQKAVEIAKQQGFDDVDLDFINTMDSNTRLKAEKMAQLADKASVNKRIIERPIDVPGESMLERIKFVENTNKKASKAVNEAAKALRGQSVDATPLAQRAQGFIDDLGVVVDEDGALDFSKSVFKNTPELQTKLNKFLSEVPQGKTDAYDLHIFKKSIDELVNYGTAGEGLKGNSATILKGMRASADDILDSAFDSYNKANTDYKVTRDVLDEARDLFGKKAGFSKEKGGQLLRSVFSNNNQRPRVMKLMENLDTTSRQFGKQFDDNLVDQALFSEILEDVYGTQATTSLQGQTQRAVKGAQRLIAGVRSPIEGALDVAGDVAEKALGVSDEKKRKILLSLLRS